MQASVLVLGAGRVTGPLFEYLTKIGISFSVVSAVESELEAVKEKHPGVQCHCLKYPDPQLPDLITQHKLTVKAVEAGVLLLCECGLDPGIDHMLAMKVIDDAVARGGKITSFISQCGGLPAPECRDNPLQYKFSWNPKTALRSLKRDAGCVKNGKFVHILGSETLRSAKPVPTNLLPLDVYLEGYPNELVDHHIKAYGLENTDYIFRGTLRYQGFSETAQALIQAGLLSETAIPQLQPEAPDITWRDLLKCLVMEGAIQGEVTGDKDGSWEDLLLTKLDNSKTRLEALRGLGLLSDILVEKKSTPIDALTAYLEKHLAYAQGERDLTVMQHEIRAVFPDQHTETTHVGLCVYGDSGGHTAMAKTVGYPVGIAAQMILEGKIKEKGIVLPTTAEIYEPILEKLEQLGITAQFSTKKT